MTKCRNRGSSSGNLGTTYGTVNYCVVAAVCCAGGSYVVLGYRSAVGVALCRDCLRVSMSTVVLTSKGLNTCFRTSRLLGYYAIIVIVSESINVGMNSGKFSITYSTVNYSIVSALCSTGGRYVVLRYGSAVGVALCRDCLRVSMSAVVLTSKGLNTCFRTSRLLGYYAIIVIVSESINVGMNSGKFSITYSTVNYSIVSALCSTGGRYVVLRYGSAIGVALSGNRSGISGNLNTTYSTVNYYVIATISCTSGSHIVLYYGSTVSMIKSGDFFRVLMIAIIVTSEGLNARLCTSGLLCYYAIIIIVSKRTYYVGIIAVTTTRTNMTGASVRITSRKNLGWNVIMSACVDFFSIGVITVISTGERHHAIFGTSGLLCYYTIIIIMSKRTFYIRYIRITANGTCIGCVSVILTSGRCYGRHVLVTFSNDFFGIGMSTVILTGKCFHTVFCTGRLLGYNTVIVIVTKSANYI